MGTNYYLHDDVCPRCGRGDEPLHIGKASAGWCFSLHVSEDLGISDLADWEERWSKLGAKIYDEYGNLVDRHAMLRKILYRSSGAVRRLDSDWRRNNQAEPGPAGLARHRVGDHCVGHGDGTYDLITGEFS